MSDVFHRLIQRIEYLERRLENLDRRANNSMREGVVTEVFPDEGMARVDAMGVVSKKVPWLQRAGDINEWTPPTKGERVLLISPTGEPGIGLILPGGYSDKFKQPHQKGGEKVTVTGSVRITQTQDSYIITVGGCTLTITSNGFQFNGGEMHHEDRNIGVDHVHNGIVPGGANTGPPQP